MPDPREDRTARALADLVADHANLSPAEREQLHRRLAAGRRGPTPPVDRAGTSPLGQQDSERQPLEERDFLRRHLPRPREAAPSMRLPSGTGSGDPGAWAAGGSLADVARAEAARQAEARKRRPPPLCVLLCDVDGLAPAGLQGQVKEAVERQLNRLDEMGPPSYRGVLRRHGYRFTVRWREGEGTAREKAAMRPFVYPMYVIDEDFRAERLLRIVREHGVPNDVAGTTMKIAQHIRDEWSAGLRGTTAPPGLGLTLYKKCAFLSHKILREGGGDKTLIANAVLHEFGHMNNIFRKNYAHPTDDSVMQTRVVTSTMRAGLRSFNQSHTADILRQIEILWSIEQSLPRSP